ncbi:MAG: 1,2-phenylacetyl-CoA epoxidase subunit PaaC [Calditrichia bacterium]
MTTSSQHIFEYLLRLGDDRLIIGHRLSEWCGHGPVLEEDIAMTNVALDLVGQAIGFLTAAGEAEGKGRDADKLAYFRDTTEFRNLLLLEQPNIDFAYTITRQFLFDAYSYFQLLALQESSNETIAGLATKSLKEVRYHLRHSREWVIRLGDGTEESHARMQDALDDLWPFTDEMFETDELEEALSKDKIIVTSGSLRNEWEKAVLDTLKEATLIVPEIIPGMLRGSRKGIHTEHLGLLLAEMQIVPRSHPGASW